MSRPTEAMSSRHAQATTRGAAAWLGIAIAVAPACEVADRFGVLNSLGSPSTLELATIAGPLGLIALFVGLGVAAAWVLPQHGRRGRWWMVGACALPLLAWGVTLGLRALVAVVVLALTICGLQLRAVQETGDPDARC